MNLRVVGTEEDPAAQLRQPVARTITLVEEEPQTFVQLQALGMIQQVLPVESLSPVAVVAVAVVGVTAVAHGVAPALVEMVDTESMTADPYRL